MGALLILPIQRKPVRCCLQSIMTRYILVWAGSVSLSPQEGRGPAVFQINTWILVTKWWLIENFIASGKNISSHQGWHTEDHGIKNWHYSPEIFSFHPSFANILCRCFLCFRLSLQLDEIYSYRIWSETAPSRGLYPWVFLQVLVGLRVYQSD